MNKRLKVGHSPPFAARIKRISKKLLSVYKTGVIVTANSLILFFLLNFLLSVAFVAKDYVDTKNDPLAKKI